MLGHHTRARESQRHEARNLAAKFSFEISERAPSVD